MSRIKELEGGLIVSCYADWSINPYMDNDEAISCMARSCIAGGANDPIAFEIRNLTVWI